MLCWEEFVELRNLHERGWSVSAIARHLGKDRKTVRRYLADPDARPGVRKPAGRLLDPYATYVEARLEDNPHLAGTVLDRELGELGLPAPTGRWPGTWPASAPTVGPATVRNRPSRW